jgi:RNA-directed DNA polymerase
MTQGSSDSGVTQEQGADANPERSERVARWRWVEGTVWTEKMLTALDNGVKGGKWFCLIDKVHRLDTLENAWRKVKSNRGTSGVDHISIERFGSNTGKYLEELRQELRFSTYRPEAIRRVFIPKANGKKRPLGIPTVKDRIVQTAIKMVMEPIFEKEFLSMSYGFRPGKSARDALREVQQLLDEGYHWVVDADIESFFDTIPHEHLMRDVAARISDGRVLSLIEAFLQQKIMGGMEQWTPYGTPQGAVLSPLLANVYLHGLDKLVYEAGLRMVRYADDFVVLCKSQAEAEKALWLIQKWISIRGLKLNSEKTHVGNCTQEGQGFDFLGYRFEAGKRQVRRTSSARLRDKIRSQTGRHCGKSITQVIKSLNPMLKGWFNYYKHAHRYTFEPIDGFIRRRLRAILRAQDKTPGRGRTHADHRRWPNKFFADLGLFTLHRQWVTEIACQSR